MSSKHTPGPWGIEQTDDTNWIGFMRPDGKKVELIVCTTSRDNFFKPETQERNDANARLIAAAPELLEALKGLLDDVQGLMSESEGVAGLHRNGDVADWASLDEGGRFERLSNMSAAIAAIAKATGGAQ
ncbi:hypothetical protein [Stenotrophomonas maltophilia]|uniref:hypothetical protein n=1 Tax=Stenotrophomonas maltophilia TaxID=40324 RepID=UPI0013DCE4E7|nr:hypothetical protein [Stenotrophomonas maltophilia]